MNVKLTAADIDSWTAVDGHTWQCLTCGHQGESYGTDEWARDAAADDHECGVPS